MDAKLDGALGVRIPLSHDCEYLRDGRVRLNKQLKAL